VPGPGWLVLNKIMIFVLLTKLESTKGKIDYETLKIYLEEN